MANTLYLLGAGASYGTRKNGKIITGLPVIREAKTELEHFHNWLIEMKESIDSSLKQRVIDRDYSYVEIIDSLISDVELMQDMLYEDLLGLKFNTPDDLEYYFFEKFTSLEPGVDKDSYITRYSKIKFILCCLLMYEQNRHGHDKRYDAFLRNITDNKTTNISDDFYVMTWNYDQQIEIAFNILYGQTLPVCIPSDKRKISDANIMKINGTANFYNVNKLPVAYFDSPKQKQLLYMMLRQYAISHKEYVGHRRLFSGGTNTLLFSWESEWFNRKRLLLQSKIKDAESLVVIGYSFPPDNSKVDSYIISIIQNLKTIYVQNTDIETPVAPLQVILDNLHQKNVRIVPITSVLEFFIPQN